MVYSDIGFMGLSSRVRWIDDTSPFSRTARCPAMQILHIDCSPRQDGQSRRISAEIVARICTLIPEATIVKRDISTLTPPDASYAALLASPADANDEGTEGSTELSDILIHEVEAASVMVLGAPVHNFTVPAALKSWLDHVVRMNRTFALGANGKQGLVADRPVLIGVAAGGFILGGEAQQPDFFTPYLRAVLGCIGLFNVHFIPVQGTAFHDSKACQSALDQALLALDPVLLTTISPIGTGTSSGPDARARTAHLSRSHI